LPGHSDANANAWSWPDSSARRGEFQVTAAHVVDFTKMPAARAIQLDRAQVAVPFEENAVIVLPSDSAAARPDPDRAGKRR